MSYNCWCQSLRNAKLIFRLNVFPRVSRISSVPMSTASDGQRNSSQKLKKASTPTGRLDDKWESKSEEVKPQDREDAEDNAYKPFPEDKNPETGEIGGPRGPEPTRYGDWERKGRVIDF